MTVSKMNPKTDNETKQNRSFPFAYYPGEILTESQARANRLELMLVLLSSSPFQSQVMLPPPPGLHNMNKILLEKTDLSPKTPRTPGVAKSRDKMVYQTYQVKTPGG